MNAYCLIDLIFYQRTSSLFCKTQHINEFSLFVKELVPSKTNFPMVLVLTDNKGGGGIFYYSSVIICMLDYNVFITDEANWF